MNKKTKRIILISIAVLLAAVLALTVYIFLLKKDNNSEYLNIRYSKPNAENIVTDDETGEEYVNNEIIITAAEGTEPSDIEKIVKQYNGEIVGYIKETNDYQIRLPETHTKAELEEMVSELETSELVDHASLNYGIEEASDEELEKDDNDDKPNNNPTTETKQNPTNKTAPTPTSTPKPNDTAQDNKKLIEETQTFFNRFKANIIDSGYAPCTTGFVLDVFGGSDFKWNIPWESLLEMYKGDSSEIEHYLGIHPDFQNNKSDYSPKRSLSDCSFLTDNDKNNIKSIENRLISRFPYEIAHGSWQIVKADSLQKAVDSIWVKGKVDVKSKINQASKTSEDDLVGLYVSEKGYICRLTGVGYGDDGQIFHKAGEVKVVGNNTVVSVKELIMYDGFDVVYTDSSGKRVTKTSSNFIDYDASFDEAVKTAGVNSDSIKSIELYFEKTSEGIRLREIK